MLAWRHELRSPDIALHNLSPILQLSIHLDTTFMRSVPAYWNRRSVVGSLSLNSNNLKRRNWQVNVMETERSFRWKYLNKEVLQSQGSIKLEILPRPCSAFLINHLGSSCFPQKVENQQVVCNNALAYSNIATKGWLFCNECTLYPENLLEDV